MNNFQSLTKYIQCLTLLQRFLNHGESTKNCHTYFPLHMWAVSPLAGAEEVESAAAIRESCPGRWGEAEGGAQTILTLAGFCIYPKDLSRLSQSRVLDSRHIHKNRGQNTVHQYPSALWLLSKNQLFAHCEAILNVSTFYHITLLPLHLTINNT